MNGTPRNATRGLTKVSSMSDLEQTKDPVQVFCRLRPLKDENEESCIKLISPTVLSVSSTADTKRKNVQYVFKHIFSSYASQKEVFENIALPLLVNVINGKNSLLFTYGVTGSGKTFTLTGEPDNPGIMPQCINTLFNTISEHQSPKFAIKSDRMNGFEIQTEEDAQKDRFNEIRANNRTKVTKKVSDDKIVYINNGMKLTDINETNLYSVFISYVEIYNNSVYDLLDESGGKVLQSKILREDYKKTMYINGVVELEVKSAEEAFSLFNIGQGRKRMASTILNSESSRSHSIFNIRIVQLTQVCHNSHGNAMIPEGNLIKIGQFSLVDLAGSERCSRTQNTGMRLKEASSINNSLMTLRTCLEILRDNQKNGNTRLIPYRDSRLTLLFKNYFEGEGQVQMIVCVNPSEQDYEENLHVMKFAEMTQEVKVTRPEVRYTPCKTPKTVKATPALKTKRTNAGAFMFGPEIPSIKLNLENAEEYDSAIAKLEEVLKIRLEKKRLFHREVTNKEKSLRKRLLDINQENVITKSEFQNIKALIRREKQKCNNLQTKIVDAENHNVSLLTKNEELQNIVDTLHYTIDEKDLKLNQNLLEKEKTKKKLALQTEKLNQELDVKLRRQREHLQAAMQAKDVKLKKVREILDTESIAGVAATSNNPPTIDVDVKTQTELSTENPTPSRNLGGNSRRRRSRSVGEIWLEHNSIKPVALGTVLQPTMKRRKSVTKLTKASDVTNPKQSKYCLIAQEPDVDGEIETKLYKGDIVPTCGGGAQVIFNDVERLRQESPTGSPYK